MSVRFLGTTLNGATIDSGPFTHVNVTATHVKAARLDTAGEVVIAVRERGNWLFEETLPLESFDVVAQSPEEAEGGSTSPAPEEPKRRRGRRGGRRRKKQPQETAPPAETTEPQQPSTDSELEAE